METAATDTSVRLSSRCLARAADLAPKDFTFVVGKREYACSRFQACFISSRVCGVLATDATVDRFCVSSCEDDGAFEHVMALANGGEVAATGPRVAQLKRLGLALGCDELCGAVVELELEGEALGLGNAVSRLRTRTEFGMCADEEVAFLGAHFYELDFDAISSLSFDEVDAVLGHDSLVLESENALLDAVIGLDDGARASGGSCAFEGLLRHVRPQNLDAAHLDTYAERARGLSSDVFDAIIAGLRAWLESCGRPLRRDGGGRLVSQVFAFNEGDPFGGILAHLRSQCGGNVHATGIVDVTASSTGYNKCEQVTDHGWNDHWCSNNTPGSWLMFDFKGRSVRPAAYSLKSNAGGHYLVKWALEGSNDGSAWTALDERETQEFKTSKGSKTFTCSGPQFFRFVRLRQTGKNSNNNDQLILSALELFGALREGA